MSKRNDKLGTKQPNQLNVQVFGMSIHIPTYIC